MVADSLSAIKYARVKPIRDENGMAVDFEIEGDFPKYGNNDDRVDELAQWAVQLCSWMRCASSRPTAGSIATQSVLTITSNVVYGKKTGSTPGRPQARRAARSRRQPHARPRLPTARWPRCSSVAKMPFEDCRGRHLLHLLHCPSAPLGKTQEDQEANLYALLDGYFEQGRPPHQRQCPEPRNAAGRDGSS